MPRAVHGGSTFTAQQEVQPSAHFFPTSHSFTSLSYILLLLAYNDSSGLLVMPGSTAMHPEARAPPRSRRCLDFNSLASDVSDHIVQSSKEFEARM